MFNKKRVVNYRAGADGYYAEGDTGVDQEALRQQRLLYSSDEATKIQEQAWQQSQLEQNGVSKSFPSYSSSSASAAAAAAAAASASSSSSSSQFFNRGRNGNTSPAQDWTSVVSADNSGVIHQQYKSKGGNGAQQRFYDRLVATPAKSPVRANYQSQSNNFQSQYNDRYSSGYSSQYSIPATRSYSQTKFQPAPVRYSAPIKSSYSSSSQRYISKTPTSQYTEQAPTSVFRPFNAHASSAASASASASASSSSYGAGSSAYGSRTAAYTSGTKGGSNGIKGSRPSPVRAARYSVPGAAHATVNFKQFGPQPFQYSYSF